MHLIPRTAKAEEFETVLTCLDQEFISGRKRHISLARRFPSVYRPENAKNIFLLEDSVGIASALACKHFDLQCQGQLWHGVMVGTVYTRIDRRGGGLASRLMNHAMASLRSEGNNFAVLWTTSPTFYARLGWQQNDEGLLGKVQTKSFDNPIHHVSRIPLDRVEPARIEGIRQQWLDCTTIRSIHDYRQLPVPAESVELLLWSNDMEQEAYALVGNAGESGFLYEMVGNPIGFPELLSAACRNRRQLFINDYCDSPSQRWLSTTGAVTWEKKPLAMWLPLAAGVDTMPIKKKYIPYFDRI
jgi:predicted N-acetyltransferase YhbS